MDIVPVFEQFALPTVMLIALMWYIMHKDKVHAEEIKEIRAEHKAEAEGFVSAINNNTEVMHRTAVVIERLCTIMNKEGTDGLQ